VQGSQNPPVPSPQTVPAGNPRAVQSASDVHSGEMQCAQSTQTPVPSPRDPHPHVPAALQGPRVLGAQKREFAGHVWGFFFFFLPFFFFFFLSLDSASLRPKSPRGALTMLAERI
jgi:hypothetical protein